MDWYKLLEAWHICRKACKDMFRAERELLPLYSLRGPVVRAPCLSPSCQQQGLSTWWHGSKTCPILRKLQTQEEFILAIVVVQFAQLCPTLQPHGLQHTRPPYPSPSPEVCPSSYPLHWWCRLAISSSDSLFSFCPQSFPASGTYLMSWLFAWEDQNTGASASVLPMSTQVWFPLWLTGLIFLLPRDFQKSSPAPQFEGINSLAFCLLYGPALTGNIIALTMWTFVCMLGVRTIISLHITDFL